VPAPPRRSETSTALIIAGRGILDQAAAELVAEAIGFRLGIPVQCPSLGGLTGIGAVAQTAPDRHPDFVVPISVGEVTPTQLDLLLSRLERVFKTSTIALANWGGRHMPAPLRHIDIVRAETAVSLVDTLRRLAAERAVNPQSRLEAV
jgi:hypothetical protein